MSHPMPLGQRLLRKLRDAMNRPPTRRQRRWAVIRALAQESTGPRPEGPETSGTRPGPSAPEAR